MYNNFVWMDFYNHFAFVKKKDHVKDCGTDVNLNYRFKLWTMVKAI